MKWYKGKWSRFRVLTKVEQINDNLFLDICKKKLNPAKKCMCEWGDTKWKWSEQGRAGSIPEIRPRVGLDQVSTDQGGKGMRKRWDSSFLIKTEVERSVSAERHGVGEREDYSIIQEWSDRKIYLTISNQKYQRTIECDERWRTSRTVRCALQTGAEIRWVTSF